MQPSSSPITPSPTLGGVSSDETALVSLTASMPRSMNELIKDVDPGKLPPRTRQIFFHVGAAIEAGWKPIELAQKLGVAPSFLSECIAELRTGLGLLNGVFPTASEDDYDSLRESVGRHGVLVPIVMDEHGIIDGHVRARACRELAHIASLAGEISDFNEIAADAKKDLNAARDAYGKDTVDNARYLVECGPELIALAGEANWSDPPIERHHGLDPTERRQLAVTLNAHRRHLERGELRLLVEVELMIDPHRTDRSIASLVGCDRSWVNKIRVQLEADEKTFGTDNSQEPVEGVPSHTFKAVAELDCPHCQHHLALMRGGREFQLELTAG